MSIAKTIAFLTTELARHGSDLLSMADLKSLGSIETELDYAGVVDADIRAVAWISSVIPGADRAAVRQAYGVEVETLLERLVPQRVLESPLPTIAGLGLGRMILWTEWGRATDDPDANVRAVGTALLAAEGSKVAEDRDVIALRDVFDIAIRVSGHSETRDRLTELREGLPVETERPATPTSPRRPRLISLSIDVVGSTAAKTRLRALAADDERRDQLYQDFYKGFLHEEGRFYDAIFEASSWGFGPPLDWRRLFVVKGIGDELWMTYDVSDLSPDPTEAEAEIARASVRLIGAAMSLVRRTVPVGGLERDTGPGFNPALEETLRFDRMELPFKVTMDLIEDAIEISDLRMDFLAPRVGSYLVADRREPGSAPVRPGAFGTANVEILNRLNAGQFALVGGHRVRQVYRTDLIGNDVDRFFRITKAALPGCVMVGETLYDHLTVTTGGEVAPGLEWVQLCYASDPNRPAGVVTTGKTLLGKRTEIPEDDLKGIGRSYVVHHLLAPEDLRGIWESANRNNLLDKTVEKLPRNLRDAIRQLPAGDAWTVAGSAGSNGNVS